MSVLPPVKKYISNTGARIYRIPCQVFETLSARVYLILGAGPPCLVDAGSGTGRSTRDILAGIEAVRAEHHESVRLDQIARIIISHGHADHIGGLNDLLRHTAAKVAVHSLDLSAIVSHTEYVAVGNSRLDLFLRQAGVEASRRAELLRISHFRGTPVEGITTADLLADDQEHNGMKIIHTPGHSPGHVCIRIGNILLSADHILARTVPQQWPECIAPYTGLGHYLESLDKVARMRGIELTLAAHEQTIHDLYGRIETIRNAHFRRLARLLDMVRKLCQPLSIDEITRHLYPEATGFRALLAITDVGSRIEYLYQRGELSVANVDELEQAECPVYRYCPT